MRFFPHIILLLLLSTQLLAEEMIIGKESIYPGIDIIFEGAPKDTVFPKENHLEESRTDIHIEMLANWSKENKFGAPSGGFVGYLEVSAQVTNQKTQKTLTTELTPHINLTDNFHYAQNIKLPGKSDDLYRVVFAIKPPKSDALGIHYDWYHKVGKVIESSTFTYKDLSFDKISKELRR
jgi:uncharacterized protein involved in high-affinity Fe2+ transport